MSEAMRVLDEIDQEGAELVALTELLARADEEHSPWCSVDADRFDALVRAAPERLALLARLVRSVADKPCGSLEYWGRDCEKMTADIERVAVNGRGKEAAESWLAKSGCWPCRIRRELIAQ